MADPPALQPLDRLLPKVLQHKMALQEINMRRGSELCYLKPLQIKSITGALMADSLIMLPTGYGKSLIFEALPYVNKTKVIVISPLNAIIEEKVKSIGDQHAIAMHTVLSQGTRISQTFRDGQFTYVFGHPEQLLKKEVCDIMKSWENVSHIIVDEAHCVVQWGHDFRPEYSKIPKLRAIFPKAHVMALTATATTNMQKDIIKMLQMKDVFVLKSSVDRPNIELIVKKRLAVSSNVTVEESFCSTLQPILDELFQNISTFPKTIIYTKLKWCGYGYDMVKRKVSLKENRDEIMTAVSQFHAPCTDEMKKKITNDMTDVAGKIKLLFATQAYGMGADAPNIERVIHIGPPSSLECYLQEIGRAGRDGRKSTAIMYYNMADLGANTIIKSEMREYCLLESCRRAYLCEHFGSVPEDNSKQVILHECCDICKAECPCEVCFLMQLDLDDMEDTNNDKSKHELESPSDLNLLSQMLSSYFIAENSQIDLCHPELITGLTSHFCQKVVDNHKNIKSEDDIISLSPHVQLQTQIVNNIFLIVQSLYTE